MPQAIAMRHRTPHFQHIFSGGGYASGYYSYLWSEALDADGFEAFEESGDIFDPDLAGRLLEYVYSAGNLRTRTSLTRASADARPSRGRSCASADSPETLLSARIPLFPPTIPLFAVAAVFLQCLERARIFQLSRAGRPSVW